MIRGLSRVINFHIMGKLFIFFKYRKINSKRENKNCLSNTVLMNNLNGLMVKGFSKDRILWNRILLMWNSRLKKRAKLRSASKINISGF